ncbi:Tpd52l1 [Phodopus roborovskii]|uniref:Tpd52l1 protein n=1 Tax=Phodopus roborovskii TaxID=109678 RepID=A0AAU9YSZ9_PHORO|nr:Tpd52l1 [Phodopus roborovskii]
MEDGLLETEPLQGRDEDTLARADFSSMLSEEEKEELKAELAQIIKAFLLALCYIFLTMYSIRHSISMPAMRNSPTFKSFEERVETTVTSLKTKVGGANPSGGSFEEVLNSTAHASSQNASGGPRQTTDEELQC